MAESWTLDGLALHDATFQIRSEGVGMALITVVRLGSTDGAATIDYKTNGETAYTGEDFLKTHGTLAFNPGEASKTFAIPIIDDAKSEAVEQLALALVNPTGGAILGPDVWARLYIEDND